jgi:membrane protein implicated in regulation of membrane protease activity
MTWENFYLICFVVGLTFSVVSFVAGSIHLHWPHFHFHVGSAPAHGPGPGSGPGAGGGRGIGRVNIGTVAAFLAWFGGTGYLLTRYYSIWFLFALGMAVMSGLGGAAVLFFFLAKVLIRKNETLDPADYEMVGVLGRVNSPIRPSGTGEMIYSQAGARRAIAARSQDGLLIPKDTEVVVTHYESGIAYVRPWEELAKSSAGRTESI